MPDKIVYTIVDNGVDGRAPTTRVYATYDRTTRDATYAVNPNRRYLNPGQEIVDTDARRAVALAKLDAVDRLVLGLHDVPAPTTKPPA